MAGCPVELIGLIGFSIAEVSNLFGPELYLQLSAQTNDDIIVISEGLIDYIFVGSALLVFHTACPLWAPYRHESIL